MSIPNASGDDAEPTAASTDADFDFSRSPHDQFFKSSLRRPEVAADLVAHYLPPDVVALLDLGSLELQEGSFIDDQLREQQSDLLFRARLLDGGETYIYLLLGGRLARWLVQLLFQPPPAEPDVRLSPHPALQ